MVGVGCWALCVATALVAAEPVVKLEVTPVEPVRVEQRGDVFFADFGKAAYANLKLELPPKSPGGELKVRLGEKLDADGTIARKPGGSVNFRELSLTVQPKQASYTLDLIPKKPLPADTVTPQLAQLGGLTPYRYVEIEGLKNLTKAHLRQLAIHAPFNDQAASFECSDPTLNQVWDLCKYTMKATTSFGVYIDGNRERKPYEADAYINQLSHYACDLDPRVARFTIEYLLKNPTWPTEWSLHMPMMAAADYRATGSLQIARNNYNTLKEKLLLKKAGPNGLLRAGAIVDWPTGETDGYNNGTKFPGDRQLGPEYNTAVNAFYYQALGDIELLAKALGKTVDAAEFTAKRQQVYDVLNRECVDAKTGLYTDGVSSQHASLHGNMFPLAFGLVPEDRRSKVAEFVQSRGMACSVYGAQYLLEAMFLAGRDEYAVQLMTAKTKRSWHHMLELGSTMTLEAWDAQYKPNLTWNHAWGAAPANIVSRYVLGVRPLEPGYAKILIVPQLGGLKWAKGQVPTAVGPIQLQIENGEGFKLEVTLPAKATAQVIVPKKAAGTILVDGKPIANPTGEKAYAVSITGGKHQIESR